jgi:hypothetical protein
MIIRIPTAILREHARQRPSGYWEDCLAAAHSISAEFIEFEEGAYNRLRWKYDPAGLGDVVAHLTAKFGIDRAVAMVEEMTGIPCGCADRQAWLNERFPLS